MVQNYAFHSAAADTKPQANGLAIFDVAGATLQVSAFSANFTSGSGVQGRFTLKIVATPEPATLGLSGVLLVSLIGAVRSRKRRRKLSVLG